MFDRLVGLIGKDNLDKISKVNIALIGVGGVGGFTLEALARSGIKNITIFDGDVIAESNLNRQIIALNENIGKSKVEVAIKRMKNIWNRKVAPSRKGISSMAIWKPVTRLIR